MVLRSVSCALVVVHPLFLAMGYVKRELLILLVANSLYMGAALVLGQAYGLLGIVLAYGVQFSSVVLPKLAIIRSEARRRPAAPEGDLATTRPPG
jgi:O-antigen/teichoic acid export membrane protein